MSKIKIYIGISASGKTTQCLKDLAKDPNGVRVNRDDLRYAVYGLTDETYSEYFNRKDWYKCEQFITDLEERIINRAISKGKNVYADNTHLKQKYIKKYYNYGVDVELKWMGCMLNTAVIRDSKRTRSVGKEVIAKQHNSYITLIKEWSGFKPEDKVSIQNDPKLPKAVIFDIDGTLAEMDGRDPYEYSKVGTDKLRYGVWQAFLAHRERGHEIIICTGRDAECEEVTKKWLEKYNITYTEYHTRPHKDNRADWMVKEEMWDDICKRYHIVCMYDDRNQVVDHARSLGFDVFQVNYGDF